MPTCQNTRSIDLLFVSRGAGRGHAEPDMAIVNELEMLAPGRSIHMCSYGTGAKALRLAGVDHENLQLPDRPPVPQLIGALAKVACQRNPKLIVVHEEFLAMPLLKHFTKDLVFLTHWFYHPNAAETHALDTTDLILYMGPDKTFILPEVIARKTIRVPLALRRLQSPLPLRSEARNLLGFSANEKILVVFSGGWSEASAPTADLIISSLASDAMKGYRVLWLTENDADYIRTRTGDLHVSVIGNHLTPELFMTAADCAISRGTYNISEELRICGTPHIVISMGVNPIDDFFARRLPTSCFYFADDISPAHLSVVITEAVDKRQSDNAIVHENQPSGAVFIAEVLAARLRELDLHQT